MQSTVIFTAQIFRIFPKLSAATKYLSHVPNNLDSFRHIECTVSKLASA